jgi:hypothetical protein
MRILDFSATKTILEVTCDILEKKFFYDKDAVSRFLTIFSDEMSEELERFLEFAYVDTLEELERSYKSRIYFTIYFVSANLRHILMYELHFTEQEIHAFENFLPSYTGEGKYGKQPQRKGTDYRKFLK